MFHVEHRFLRILLIIIALTTFTACEKPLAEPESVDPIYRDLRNDQANAEKAAEDKKKEAEGLEATLEKSGATMSDLERRHTQQQIFAAKKAIALTEQDVQYAKLSADTRKALDRDIYPEIFKNKGKWPDMDEYERFQASRRLRAASRNWNDRVPKPPGAPTKDNPTGEKKEAKPEAKAEGKAEGAEKKE